MVIALCHALDKCQNMPNVTIQDLIWILSYSPSWPHSWTGWGSLKVLCSYHRTVPEACHFLQKIRHHNPYTMTAFQKLQLSCYKLEYTNIRAQIVNSGPDFNRSLTLAYKMLVKVREKVLLIILLTILITPTFYRTTGLILWSRSSSRQFLIKKINKWNKIKSVA